LALLDERSREIATAIERWTAAISVGGELASLVEKLKVCEQDRARLDQERRRLETVTRAGRLDLCQVERELMKRVEDWRTAAGRNVSQGRQVIRKLLGGTRVKMRPLDDGTCELSGRADYGKLFSGIVATALASPTGTANGCHLRFTGLAA
jgi:hypothetical protein